MKPITIPTGAVQLTGGIVGHRDKLNTENLMRKIDPHMFATIFESEHESWFAEPEFAGQYVDALVQHYRRHRDDDFLARAKIVIDSILANQREDGYLGTYRAGLEFDETFSVWNQAFVIKGMVSYYEVTGEQVVLDAAQKCADFIAGYYLAPGAPDMLRSVNQSIQHTTILHQVVRLYRMTKKQLYLDFAEFIIRRWEETTIKFVSAPLEWLTPLLEMGALKAIESFVCYQGIVELYEATGTERYLAAAERYWELIRRNQINIIGCGSITELWVIGGNRPANTPIDVHPNETCVAWGWARLSMMLWRLTGKPRYVDAIEQTLYNHILGAQAADGSDFSYYQGLVGRKVHVKSPGQYSCCRYRGLHYLAYTPDFVVANDESRLFVNLYTPARARLFDGAVIVEITTDYPRSGKVRIDLQTTAARRFALNLRVPGWCDGYTLRVDGESVDSRPRAELAGVAGQTPDLAAGYHVVDREWSAGAHTVELALELTVRLQRANVDHRDSVGITYGPLTLAIDSTNGTPIHSTRVSPDGDSLALEPIDTGAAEYLPIVRFHAPGAIDGEPGQITLVDYASAGSAHPNEDEFKVWLPVTS